MSRFTFHVSRLTPRVSRSTFNVQRFMVADRAIAVLIVTLVLLGWEGAIWLSKTPVYLLPAPSAILQKLLVNPWPLLLAGGTTLVEALAGLLLGSSVGLVLALLLLFLFLWFLVGKVLFSVLFYYSPFLSV